MNPLYESVPVSSGSIKLPRGDVYYELRGKPSNPQKVVLLMGAFATLKHFEQLADFIAASFDGSAFEVVTFDYRGIGKSTNSVKLEKQNTSILASDTNELINELWGKSQPVHVYGASMGGMVAQTLAVILLREKRLKSLCLAVTARCHGMSRYVPIGPRMYQMLLPLFLSSKTNELVDLFLSKCFSTSYLQELHPTNGKSMKELWSQRWNNEFNDWFSLHNIEATASQASVAGTHYLTDTDAEFIRNSGIPVFIGISENDELMSPKAQHELAKLLGIRDDHMLISSGGHMGSTADFQALCQKLTEYFHQNI